MDATVLTQKCPIGLLDIYTKSNCGLKFSTRLRACLHFSCKYWWYGAEKHGVLSKRCMDGWRLHQSSLWASVFLFLTTVVFNCCSIWLIWLVILSTYGSRWTKNKPTPMKTHQLALGNEQEQQLVKEYINNADWWETLAAAPLSCWTLLPVYLSVCLPVHLSAPPAPPPSVLPAFAFPF